MIPPVIVPVSFKDIANAIINATIYGNAKISEFEQEISKYNNCQSILTSSGKTALYVLVKSYGFKKGDEIVMPAYMCETVSSMLLNMGFKLKFVDVNPNTYNLCIEDLNKKVSRNTKAILAVHMFGIPCDMESIMDLAQDRNSIVIEDAAQAIGAEYKDRKAGTIADSGFFSFGRGKPITAMGGGAIVTKDDNIAAKCRTIVSDFENKSSFNSDIIKLIGYSSLRNRMFYNMVRKKVRSEGYRVNINPDKYKFGFSSLQASIGLSQLHKLNKFNTKRQKNANILKKELKNIDWIKLPEIYNHSKPIFLRFPIRVKDVFQRDRLMHRLEKHGIETSIVYPIPLPRLYNINSGEYAGVEEVVNRIIALPTHPLINNDDIKTIIQIFQSDLT